MFVHNFWILRENSIIFENDIFLSSSDSDPLKNSFDELVAIITANCLQLIKNYGKVIIIINAVHDAYLFKININGKIKCAVYVRMLLTVNCHESRNKIRQSESEFKTNDNSAIQKNPTAIWSIWIKICTSDQNDRTLHLASMCLFKYCAHG